MDLEIITKCGYRCDLCLAYKANVEERDQRKILSAGWYDIYGFRIEPEDIYCEGCVSCDEPILIDKNCPVRSCVISKSLENCAECVDYFCDKLKERIVDRSDLERKLSRKLSDHEYMLFVFPYESKGRMEKIRK